MSATKTDESKITIKVKTPTEEFTREVEKSKSGRDLKSFLKSRRVTFLRVNGKPLNDDDFLDGNVKTGDTVVAHEGIEICIRCTDRNDMYRKYPNIARGLYTILLFKMLFSVTLAVQKKLKNAGYTRVRAIHGVRAIFGYLRYIVVDPHESVPNLKALIQQKKGIPLAEQLLLYEGSPLEDIATLLDYKIGDRTVLSVSRVYLAPTISINISTFAGDFSLVVEPNDSIKTVKAKIGAHFKEKLALNQQIQLIYGRKSLQEQHETNFRPLTLIDHGVKDGSELFAIIRFICG